MKVKAGPNKFRWIFTQRKTFHSTTQSRQTSSDWLRCDAAPVSPTLSQPSAILCPVGGSKWPQHHSNFFDTFLLAASPPAPTSILCFVRVKMATTPTTMDMWRRYRATWRQVRSRVTPMLAKHQGQAKSSRMEGRREASQEYRDRGDKRRDTAALLLATT